MWVGGWLCGCAHALRNVWGPEEGTRFPRAGVTGGCEPSSMGASSQTGPQKEQQVLLASEISLQSHYHSLKYSP